MTTARSNAGSIPTRLPTAFISRAKGWPCDTLPITRASANISPACTGSTPESRSASVSDLPRRLSMPPRAALVPKRQLLDRSVFRPPPRAACATCPVPALARESECHRAAYARSARESPRRRQTASCSRVRTERVEVRAPAPRVLPPDGDHVALTPPTAAVPAALELGAVPGQDDSN